MSKKLPTALEGAYAVVLAQNGLLVSRAAIDLLYRQDWYFSHLAIIFIGIINFLNVATTWVLASVTAEDKDTYSAHHLFLDIVTLAILFVLSQALIEFTSRGFDSSVNIIYTVASVCYGLLSFMYVLWNNIAIDGLRSYKDEVEYHQYRSANLQNFVALLIALGLLITSALHFSPRIVTSIFIIWVAYWFCVMLLFIRKNNRLMHRTKKHLISIGMVKTKADWLGPASRQISQLFVSLRSYVLSPWSDATQSASIEYFKGIYSKQVRCDLIFDGSDFSYLKKVSEILNASRFHEANVVDIGCGSASMYGWIVETGAKPSSYTGIDPAQQTRSIDPIGNVVSLDATSDLANNILESSNILIFVNSSCYLSDSQFLNILDRSSRCKRIVLVEPIPGIFWDKYFDNVRPKYRKLDGIRRLLDEAGFRITGLSQDYWFKIGSIYFWPLSLALVAELSEESVE